MFATRTQGQIAPVARGRAIDRTASGHLGQQMGPRPRDDLHRLVAAAAGNDPPAIAQLVGQLVQPPIGHPLAVDAHHQVGQRVKRVGVAAVLGEQHLRLVGPQHRRDDSVEGAPPPRVADPHRQRDVDIGAQAVARPGLVGPAGPGKQRPPALVHRHGQYTRVVVERRLDPVTVVHIDIDVRHPRGAGGQQPSDRDRRVVVDTEPRGPVAHRVVQTARDVDRVLGRPLPHRAGRLNARTGHQRRSLVHLGKNRDVPGAEAVAQRKPTQQVVGGTLHRGDVERVMHQRQQVVLGRGRRDHCHARAVEDAELTGERHRQRQPHRPQRVGRPEVIVGEDLVPNDQRAVTH